MTIETRIQDAIADVRSEPHALVEIAADYDLNPATLKARIVKAYGSVEALVGREAAQADAEARMQQERAEKLTDAIAALRARYDIRREPQGAGTVFTYEGDTYTFVLLSANHRKYFAQTIRHSDFAVVGWSQRGYNTVIAPAFAKVAA